MGLATQPSNLNGDCAVGIAECLQLIYRPVDPSAEFEEAVRLLIDDLWHVLGGERLSRILQGSWAGGVLESMKDHQQRVQSERSARAEYESAAQVQKRREEKRGLKHEKHKQRLELKKERDRIWFDKQTTRTE